MGGNILVYISSVERDADHDPSLHPNYWGNLSRLATEISVDNTTNTHFRRGMLIYTHEDEVYLCTTNAQAATARDLTYVKEKQRHRRRVHQPYRQDTHYLERPARHRQHLQGG